MYTAQIDRHGNIIVCRGAVERSGYQAFYWGSYNDCLKAKVSALPDQPSRWHTRSNGQPLDTEQ